MTLRTATPTLRAGRALTVRTTLPVLALALAPLTTAIAQSPARVVVRAENALDLRRENEVVTLPWAEVTRRLAGARPDRVRAVDAAGRELPTQVMDDDGDGTSDALLVLADFWPKESKSITIEAAPAAKVEPRAFVRHDDPRDDMAWESDRIAFRIYGEGLKKTSSAMSSSGIDVWPKSVHKLVVEKWYTKGHDAYHIDTGEGADFYDVGETLGNGGTAVWGGGDTLYRADNFKAWKVVANGPIRAVFELKYDPWKAGALEVSETKRFTIDAGQNLYKEESVFRTASGADVPYVIGTLKRPGMVGTFSKAQPWAWLTGWGQVAKKNGGHGELGTAVLLPRDRVADWKETKDHYLALSRAKSGETVTHYIGAGWTASNDFPTPQSWWAYLDAAAQRIASPVRISFLTTAAR